MLIAQSPFQGIIEVSKPLLQKGKVIKMANKTNDLAHTKWMCKYHIVFTPKYRRKIIYNQYKESIRDILKQLCAYKGVEIIEGNFWTYILLCFTSFFTLVNPLGIMPVFLTMTQSMGDVQRKKIVRKSTVIAFLTLVSFTVFGRFLFMVFGLSTNGFRLAGGIVIFKIGWDMLQAQFTRMKLADTEIKEYADDISITPLAIPMLCGPGGIANGIVLMEDARTPLYVAGLVTVIAVVFLITYLILKASTRLVEIIGETGNVKSMIDC